MSRPDQDLAGAKVLVHWNEAKRFALLRDIENNPSWVHCLFSPPGRNAIKERSAAFFALTVKFLETRDPEWFTTMETRKHIYQDETGEWRKTKLWPKKEGNGAIQRQVRHLQDLYLRSQLDGMQETWENWHDVEQADRVLHDKVRAQNPYFFTVKRLYRLCYPAGLPWPAPLATSIPIPIAGSSPIAPPSLNDIKLAKPLPLPSSSPTYTAVACEPAVSPVVVKLARPRPRLSSVGSEGSLDLVVEAAAKKPHPVPTAVKADRYEPSVTAPSVPSPTIRKVIASSDAASRPRSSSLASDPDVKPPIHDTSGLYDKLFTVQSVLVPPNPAPCIPLSDNTKPNIPTPAIPIPAIAIPAISTAPVRQPAILPSTTPSATRTPAIPSPAISIPAFPSPAVASAVIPATSIPSSANPSPVIPSPPIPSSSRFITANPILSIPSTAIPRPARPRSASPEPVNSSAISKPAEARSASSAPLPKQHVATEASSRVPQSTDGSGADVAGNAVAAAASVTRTPATAPRSAPAVVAEPTPAPIPDPEPVLPPLAASASSLATSSIPSTQTASVVSPDNAEVTDVPAIADIDWSDPLYTTVLLQALHTDERIRLLLLPQLGPSDAAPPPDGWKLERDLYLRIMLNEPGHVWVWKARGWQWVGERPGSKVTKATRMWPSTVVYIFKDRLKTLSDSWTRGTFRSDFADQDSAAEGPNWVTVMTSLFGPPGTASAAAAPVLATSPDKGCRSPIRRERSPSPPPRKGSTWIRSLSPPPRKGSTWRPSPCLPPRESSAWTRSPSPPPPRRGRSRSPSPRGRHIWERSPSPPPSRTFKRRADTYRPGRSASSDSESSSSMPPRDRSGPSTLPSRTEGLSANPSPPDNSMSPVSPRKRKLEGSPETFSRKQSARDDDLGGSTASNHRRRSPSPKDPRRRPDSVVMTRRDYIEMIDAANDRKLRISDFPPHRRKQYDRARTKREEEVALELGRAEMYTAGLIGVISLIPPDRRIEMFTASDRRSDTVDMVSCHHPTVKCGAMRHLFEDLVKMTGGFSSNHLSHIQSENPGEAKEGENVGSLRGPVDLDRQLTQSLLDLIKSNLPHAQTLFPQGRSAKLSQWKTTRDICIELFVQNKEVLWLKDQARLGRVERVDGTWRHTAQWTSSYNDPVASRLAFLQVSYQKVDQIIGKDCRCWKNVPRRIRSSLKSEAPWFFTYRQLLLGDHSEEPVLSDVIEDIPLAATRSSTLPSEVRRRRDRASTPLSSRFDSQEEDSEAARPINIGSMADMLRLFTIEDDDDLISARTSPPQSRQLLSIIPAKTHPLLPLAHSRHTFGPPSIPGFLPDSTTSLIARSVQLTRAGGENSSTTGESSSDRDSDGESGTDRDGDDEIGTPLQEHQQPDEEDSMPVLVTDGDYSCPGILPSKPVRAAKLSKAARAESACRTNLRNLRRLRLGELHGRAREANLYSESQLDSKRERLLFGYHHGLAKRGFKSGLCAGKAFKFQVDTSPEIDMPYRRRIDALKSIISAAGGLIIEPEAVWPIDSELITILRQSDSLEPDHLTPADIMWAFDKDFLAQFGQDDIDAIMQVGFGESPAWEAWAVRVEQIKKKVRKETRVKRGKGLGSGTGRKQRMARTRVKGAK